MSDAEPGAEARDLLRFRCGFGAKSMIDGDRHQLVGTSTASKEIVKKKKKSLGVAAAGNGYNHGWMLGRVETAEECFIPKGRVALRQQLLDAISWRTRSLRASEAFG